MSPLALAVSGAAAAVTLLFSAAPAAGAGARYTVLKCHTNSRPATEAIAEVRGNYSTQNRCAGADQRLEVANAGFATPGQTGYWRFNAPPGTAIVGLNVRANLRRDNHHLAQLAVVDAQNTPTVLANGPDTGQGFQNYHFQGLDDRAFVLHLTCSDGGGCASSSQAHAYAQNIELVLEDREDPRVTVISGTLVDGGWVRGAHRLDAQASDVGGGLESLRAKVSGFDIGGPSIACAGSLGGPYTSLVTPCPTAPAVMVVDLVLDTGSFPFVDGENILAVCAEDFAGNAAQCGFRSVLVDNAAPVLTFPNAQDQERPELIRVAMVEVHSGVDVGEISYRRVDTGLWQPLATTLDGEEMRAQVDSSALPPGDYEFRANATDVAGNGAETTRRADGSPMVLTFPLREPVKLTASLGPGNAKRQTIRYGGDSKASGQLLDSNGHPLAGREVTVHEYFGAGALIDRRIRVVTTDAQGRWSSALPAGPSRSVSVTFAGSPRFQAVEHQAGRLTVRSRASFRTSQSEIPEGGRIRFTGKVGHYGARIPAGGKLVELQVQESAGRWNTVREAFHTASSGRYRLGYRFGRFYETDARFKFRVKVAREQGWPYKAPVTSKPHTVTVLAR